VADSIMSKFQVPPQMRHFAEQSFEQARTAFDGLFAATQRAVASFEDQAEAAQSGAKDMQRKAVSYAERNIAASFEYAHRLLQARAPNEVVRLHTDHIGSQIEALTTQARELGRTAAARPGRSPN